MAKKTNCTINGKEYFRIYRKVGKKLNKRGKWVDVYRNFYGDSRADAERKYTEYMQRQKKKLTGSQCAGELIAEWIEAVFLKNSLSDGTKYNYVRAFNNLFIHSEIAGQMLDDISALDLQIFYNEIIDGGAAVS